jgi:pSer/pThr/pTyr-binding forkhead associated (FHA) protein
MRVGRSAECEVVVADEGASRVHAVFRLETGRVVVEDAGSRNGTFVNGERVERRVLRPGDRVRVGAHTELELAAEEEAAVSTTLPSPERRPAGQPGAAARGGVERPAVTAPRARRRRDAPAAPVWRRLFTRTDFLLEPVAGGRGALALTRRVTTVGREPPAGAVVDDDSVSRLHARLDRAGDQLMVTDLKSRNGTTVNGEPVLRAGLGEGDVVSFGDAAFEVRRQVAVAWPRLALAGGLLALLVVAGFGVRSLGDYLAERAAVSDAQQRLRRQALQSVKKGIVAFRAGDVEYARSYLLYAADVMLGSNLAPPGSALDRPQEVLRPLLRDLPPEDRSFDFSKALDPTALPLARARLEGLSNREYVEHQTRRIAIELGLDENVPPGFAAQVWQFVDWLAAPQNDFQVVLDRSRTLQPRMRQVMAQAHLPEAFCYVAWVESALNPQARSAVGARGLWQFVESTARLYGLRVDPAHGVDERTDPAKSTQAATRYIGDMLKTFGREQFMMALASYNRGEAGVRSAMRKIDDPMMESSRKFWYLVERHLLPRETSEYVPKIFANQIVAEDPERFGLRRP